MSADHCTSLTNALLLVSLLAVLALAACNDTSPSEVSEDTSTDVVELREDGSDALDGSRDEDVGQHDDLREMDTVCHLTRADCLADGLELAPVTCECIEVVDYCLDVGCSCDPETPLPAGFVCIADDSGDGTIRHACRENSDCPVAEYCSAEGGCIPVECSGFFPDPSCPPPGPVPEGEPCDRLGECASGLICAGGVCSEPECTPLSGEIECPDPDLECRGLTLDMEAIDIGFCEATCDPWADTDDCGTAGDGQACWPEPNRNDSGDLRGTCTDAGDGTAVQFETCRVGSTDPSLQCSSTDNGDGPLFCIAETCELTCDPQDQSTCPTEQECREIPLTDQDGNPLDQVWGICVKPCTPWVAPEDSGCAMDEFCEPSFEVSGQGQCVPSVTGEDATLVGERCDVLDALPCEDGTVCLGTTDDQGNDIAECFAMCDPTASLGDAGACSADMDGNDQACAALFNSQTNSALAIGTCFADACDVAAQTACPQDDDGNDQVCVTGAFNLGAVDFCTTLPADPVGYFMECPASDYEEFAICNDNALCIDLGAPTDNMIQCVELCDGTESGFGAPGHPECVNNVNDGLTATTCTQLFNALLQNLGVCQPE